MSENKTIANPATAPGSVLYCPVVAAFVVTTWDALKNGEEVWYLIPDRRGYVREEELHGPFDVIDASEHRLRNMSGVTLQIDLKSRLVMLRLQLPKPEAITDGPSEKHAHGVDRDH